MKGLIISSGSFSKYELLEEVVIDSDYILCADGGLKHLMKLGKCPNAIIGDLDSVDSNALEYINKNNISVIKFPVEKDETDTELAVLNLMEMGCKKITLIGATGSRIDHTLGNILLLRNMDNNGIKAKIVDDNNTIYFCKDFLELSRKDNHYISVIPITLEGVTVTLSGFYYPLNNTIIKFGSTLGISNKIIEKIGIIKIISGEALITESLD